MNGKWNMVGMMAIFLSVGNVIAVENGLSVSALPDKILYDPGETAKIEVTVKNESGAAFEGKLVVSVTWEMEDTKVLLDKPVKLGVGETNVMEVKWEKIPEVLGCEARAELKNGTGECVATGSHYFNVCRHLDMLRVGIHGHGLGLMSYSKPEFLEGIRKSKPKVRYSYINIGEYFIGKSHVWNLAPEEDEYPGGAYWESNTGVKTAIEEGHKIGQQSVAYVTSYTTHGLDDLEVSLQHPEWLAFDKGGHPMASVSVKREDFLRNPTYGMIPSPGPFNSAVINWMDQEALDYHINQLIANHKLVGMDGVRYDGEPGSQWGDLDIEGKPFPSGEARAQERIRMIRYIKERVRKEIPSYLFMFNAGRAVGQGNPVDLKNGKLAPDLKPTVEGGCASCDEEIRGANSAINEFHAWKKYADVMVSDVDLTRADGGFAYCIFPYGSNVHKNTEEIGYSIMLAAGDHPWFAMPGDRASDLGGTHYPIMCELFAFATRFSAMLWGKGIDRVRDPESVVEVTSEKGDIWWKNFVQQRVLADGRKYIVIHLLNAPPNDAMGVTEQPLPEVIKNIQVNFKVPVKKAWMAAARPGPAKKTLRHADDKNGYEAYGPMKYGPVPVENGKVIVPELRVWTMVVVELKM